jgi:regulator of sigma E protease
VRLRPILGPVAAGSIAARAGLRGGDVIEAVGARAVRTRGAARARILSAIRSRGRVRLLVGAGGSSRPVTLKATGSGTPLSLTRLGVRFAAVHIPTKIARVVPGGPAAKAGLEAGDRIVSIDGREVRDWAALMARVRPLPGKLVRLGVRRGRQVLTVPVRIGRQVIGGRAVGALWVRAAVPVTPKGWTVRIRYGPLEALAGGILMAWRLSVLEVKAVWNLITLHSSVRDFADSRWVAALSGDSAGGPGSLLAFLAEISITLGLVNLLPVPGLDGGQILFELTQWARGISEEHSEMSVAGRVQGDVECGRVPGDRPAAGKRSRAEDECRRL